MLNKRIGGAIIIKDGIAVQSIGFGKYLPIGDPAISVEFLNQWGIDEITILDISATKNGRKFDNELLKRMAAHSNVPLAVGGGINSIEDIDILIKNGADKVCINHGISSVPGLLNEGAEKYGDQCMIAAIDFVKQNGNYYVYDYINKKNTGVLVSDYVTSAEQDQAGEILLQSVERDGRYNGFELELFEKICPLVGIPVISLGGAGNPLHFLQLFSKANVAAAYAGNFFNFTEHSVITVKKYLMEAGCAIRLETMATYEDYNIDENNRINKKSDEALEHLLFTKIEKEII